MFTLPHAALDRDRVRQPIIYTALASPSYVEHPACL
jgi:hypothetical protein